MSVAVEELNGPTFADLMASNGLTAGKLIHQLKKELKANSKKTVKVRGAVGKGQLKNGHKVVAVSGYVVETKEGTELYGTGETVLESSEPNWTIRQNARMDAQKLMGLYPAEKNELSGPNGSPLFSLYEEVKGKAGSLVNDPNKRG
jgi:hypothetical protein